ncbi:copper amine oxidase N-terminal domain-containing protein [Paenibacillus sp. CN-4]|uniref:copper amine oxidase N-terminal domain-containing protein n=1 Tax=Paenibacillus nanchangensis TaxID=3348343 RepID=UPI00397A617D
MMKYIRYPAALLWLALLISITPVMAAAGPAPIKVTSVDAKIVFDGQTIQPPAGQHVFIIKNTTYVPLRFISYALNKSVVWDNKSKKVAVSDPGSVEKVTIKDYLANAVSRANSGKADEVITYLTESKVTYTFDGSAKSVPSGLTSYMLDGTLYVPLRFLSESVGIEIGWNQKTKTITGTSGNSESTPITSPAPTATPAATSAATSTVPVSSPSASPKATPAPSASPAAGGNGGTGGTGGGQSSKVSYEQITGEAESKLNALRGEAVSTLFGLYSEYTSTTDAAAKEKLKAQGKAKLSQFTASFESIVADAEAKLKANGHSTSIISQYRSEFNSQIQAGMGVLGN